MKKRKSGDSCFLCEKSNAECDANRPCARCVKLGTPQMCTLNYSPSASFITKSSTSNVTNIPVKSVPNNQQISVSPILQPQTSIQNTNSHQVPVSTPISPLATNSNLVTNPTPNQSHLVDITFEDKQETINKPQTSVQSRNIGPINSSQTRTTVEAPGYQMNINSFMMTELKKLKEDQQRLQDELLAMKISNMKLNTKFESLSMPKRSDYYISGINPTSAMVVFDLTKNPAIVLTTNETFCKMVGYEMKDVLGCAWHKFIPAEYIDRTMNKLSQRNLKDSVIQFDQVYKHKDAGIFPALDTHTIFFANGKPVSDLVFITLSPSGKFSSSETQHTIPISSRTLLSLEDGTDVAPLSPDSTKEFPFTSLMKQLTELDPNSPPHTPINEDSFYGPNSPLSISQIKTEEPSSDFIFSKPDENQNSSQISNDSNLDYFIQYKDSNNRVTTRDNHDESFLGSPPNNLDFVNSLLDFNSFQPKS